MAHLECETKEEFGRIKEPWDTNAPDRATDPESLEKGRQIAAIIVLKRLWRQYFKWQALSVSDCPVANLFSEEATMEETETEEEDEEEDDEEEEDDDDEM